MAGKYNVNWEKHETKGNVIRSGRKLILTTRPVTPMFSAVIIKNYKKVGRNWRGTPILVTQEKFHTADGKLEINLKRRYRGETKNIPKGKYMLITWIAHPRTFNQTKYHDEFEIV